MEERFVEVLDPIGEVEVEEYALAPRFADLKGKTIGLLANSNRVFEMLSRRLEELLRERHGVTDFVREDKRGAPSPKLIEELAYNCDLVIGGLGV